MIIKSMDAYYGFIVIKFFFLNISKPKPMTSKPKPMSKPKLQNQNQ
jgi:hypothetical protein